MIGHEHVHRPLGIVGLRRSPNFLFATSPGRVTGALLSPTPAGFICGLFDDVRHSQRLRCRPACFGLIDGVRAGADGIRTALSGDQPLEFEHVQVLRALDEPDNVRAAGPKDLMRRLELADDSQFAKAAVALGQQVIQPVAPLAIGSFMGLALAALPVVGVVLAERPIGRQHRVVPRGLHRPVPLLRRGGK